MISLKRTALALSLGSLVFAGSAFAQNVQPSLQDQSYDVPSCMMGVYPVQTANGSAYIFTGCPYWSDIQVVPSSQPSAVQQQQQQTTSAVSSSNTQTTAQTTSSTNGMPSLSSRLNMLDDFLQLNDQQQMTFGAYAQALLNAQAARQSAKTAIANATTNDERIAIRLQDLKTEVAALENISKLRQAFVSSLNPQQIQKFELAETNPVAAMALAYRQAALNSATQAASASQTSTTPSTSSQVASTSTPTASSTQSATASTQTVPSSQTAAVSQSQQSGNPQVIYFIPSSVTQD